MKSLYKFLIAISFIYLAGMYVLGKSHKKEVLGITSTPSPSDLILLIPSPSAVPTPAETPSPTPTKTPLPTSKPTPIPSMAPSSEVNSLIDRFSGQYGVDPNVVRYIALCESGFRSNAKNGPYIGLFQFGPITWKNLRIEIGEDANLNLRYSAEESVQTATYALSHGKNKIWPNCVP